MPTSTLAALLVLSALAGERPLLEVRFERAADMQAWVATPKASLEHLSVADEGGRWLRVVTKGGEGLRGKGLKLPALERCGEVEFRVRARPAVAGEECVLELQAVTPEHGWFWRKVEAGPEWSTVRLPLRWFRWSQARVPRWDEVNELRFWFRSAGTFEIDDLRLSQGEGEAPAEVGDGELATLAFGEGAAVERFASKSFAILTDCEGLDGDAILGALSWMEAAVRRDFPALKAPRRPARLLVFAREDDYRSFWPRFAQGMNSDAQRPSSDGFTMMGIASSFAGDVAVRPVFVHEGAHALLTATLRLDNSGEWVQEGLATRYQLEHMGEPLRSKLGPWLEGKAERPALGKLASGKPVGSRNYALAAAAVGFFLDDPARRRGFHTMLEAMSKGGGTDLARYASTWLERDVDALDAEWAAWLETAGH